jgi:hypothetical protein
MRRLLIAAVLTSFANGLHADTVYRCAGPDGEAYFTDLACAGGTVQTLDPADVLTIPAPDAHEIANVQRIDRAQAARERAADKERLAQQRANLREAAARARSCAAAREGLDRVHEIKRRGYTIASSGDLNARERKYNLLAERNCG